MTAGAMAREITLIVFVALFIGLVVGFLAGCRYQMWGDLRFWNL